MLKGMKRFLGVFMTAVICISACPVAVLAAPTVNQQQVQAKIAEIAKQYPHGSFFSKNGQACGHGQDKSCSNCNSVNIAKQNGKAWASKEGSSWTCLGFTKYVYHEVFGVGLGSAISGTVTASIVGDGPSTSYETYKNAKLGDVIYFRNVENETYLDSKGNKVSNTGHYGIFISADETGVTIYHSNVSKANSVEYRKYDYKKDASYLWKYVTIRHANNYISHVCSQFTDLGVCTECHQQYTLTNVQTGMTIPATAAKADGAMHSSPYGAAAVTGRLKAGKTYTVVQRATNAFGYTWYQVKDVNDKNNLKWVVGEYLNVHKCTEFDKDGKCKTCKTQFQLKDQKTLNVIMMATKNDGAMHKTPYGEGEINGRLIGQQYYLVTGSAVNGYGNLWYLVRDTDGMDKWVVADYLKSVSGSPTAVTMIKNVKVKNITTNEARVTGQIKYAGTKPAQVGLRVGTSKNNLAVVAIENLNHSKNPFDIWYDVSADTNINLKQDTRYYYQFFVMANGKLVPGPIDTFKTESYENNYGAVKQVTAPAQTTPKPTTLENKTTTTTKPVTTIPNNSAASATQSSSVNIKATSAKNVTQTNAVVYGNASYTSTKPTEVGLYIGTSQSNMKLVASDPINHSKNPFDIWYDLNQEAGMKLQPGTTYYYKLYATVNGTKQFSNTVSFTTAAAAAPVTAKTTGVKNVTATNAVVCGSVSYTGARPTKVGLYFGTNRNAMRAVASDTISHNKNPFDIWYDLNQEANQKLTSGTTYYYQFYVVQNGVTYTSNIASFNAK